MKNYITMIFLAGSLAKAQVAIGKSSVSGSSSLLEFVGMTAGNLPGDTETANFRGIILPAVATTPVFGTVTPVSGNVQNGTFLLDRLSKKVRMYESGRWVDMTDEATSGSFIPVAGSEAGAGVIIGSASSSASGVLVLESSDKALVLPHIKNPHASVKSPYPGMMCYDTVSNSIAVYDGDQWSYWK